MSRKDHDPLTPAVFHILLSLSDDALHGYAIMKRVETDSGLSMGPGTVYGALRRLTDAGWVLEEPVPDSDDPRRGKAFSLTPEGRKALAREAERITKLAGLGRVRALSSEARA